MENFEKIISEFFECCYASLIVRATGYLVIAVYRPPGLNVQSFIEHFTILFAEKSLQFDKIVLLCDFNISLNVKNDASKIWNSFCEDFDPTEYVSEKTHRDGGTLYHVIASKNISINVKSNSFITSSDQSFICFSISSVKKRKSRKRLMYRNWKKFESEGLIIFFKLCLKFDVASSICEAWDMYLRFEENFLDSVLPLEIKRFSKHQCPFLDDELLWLKRKKRKTERKYRKSKTSVLKSEYENIIQMFFEKFLEKRGLYIENKLMEICSRKEFGTLKLLHGQDVEQLPKCENKQTARKRLQRVLYI